MVTGDHHRTDTGAAALCDGTDDFLTLRVDHSDHSDEDQAALDLLHLGGYLLHGPVGHCQHPEGRLGHGLVALLQVHYIGCSYLTYSVRSFYPVAD